MENLYYLRNKVKIFMLLAAFIGVLSFGPIYFTQVSMRHKNLERKHSSICKFMRFDFIEENGEYAPDSGTIPTPDIIRFPKINTPSVAAEIGTTLLGAHYGEAMTEMQKPYMVSLINDEIWEVKGSLSKKDYYVMIQRSDCRILSMKGYSYTDYLTNRSKKLVDIVAHNVYKPDYSPDFSYLGERKEVVPFKRLPFKGDIVNKYLFGGMYDNGYTPDSSIYRFPYGILKDYETAAKVGIVILSSIYGNEQIKRQFPFEVYSLNDKYWSLVGTFYSKGPLHHGGSAMINIQKADCRIIACGHEK